MKQKAIEKIAPVQPTREGEYITTVQKMDNILILNVYKNGELSGRHALNPETGEYSQYRAKEKDWKCWKYGALLGLDTSWYGYYSLGDKKRAVFDTPEQEQMVREALEVSKKIHWQCNTYDLIDDAEKEYLNKKRKKAEDNRRMRVQEKMNLVPELPEDAHEWIWQQEGAKDFVFLHKQENKWHCSACQKAFPEKYLKRIDASKKIRHNDEVICPRCKKTVTAKKRVDEIKLNTHFALLQKMDHRMSVLRHFDVRILWDMKGRKVYINEAVRIVLYHTSTLPKYCAEIFYNQYGTGGVYCGSDGWSYEYSHFDNKSNPSKRREYAGFLYPDGIEEALNDTAYIAWGRIFAQMAAAKQKLNYNRLLVTQNNTKLVGVIEYLFKGRFNKLLEDTAESVSYWSHQYCGRLCINGENIEEIFAIHDRQLINRIRDVDGGEQMVMWMRWSCDEGKKIPQEVLEWLSKNDIKQGDVKFIKDRMSLQQIMNYVNRQQAEGYKSKTAKQILNQWSDYLEMLRTLGKKTDDEMMYRPRELKRRHNECVEEIRRQQMIAEMKRNAKQRAAEAKRMREKFPGAEEILKEIKPKYEYQNNDYIITVPTKLIEIVAEGQALHHCAGSSDRYFDRIMQRETYICFLRKASDPKTPYYTIEVEPSGTIRQHRGYLDEEPEIELIKPFLREWQKEIKKRLTENDRKYAAISAKKREENIEELKAKNNTRVLEGLMEDFMEAVI
ncbi:MAG: PcfJ domain-containing protein [Lachnospiraceae bacterium]|nr:PcfJ domain-containing protein [Lachnospiraceae bacterium]